MSEALPIIAGLAWLVSANVLGLIPSKDNHWTRAYVLIALGIPLLIWIGMTFGSSMASRAPAR